MAQTGDATEMLENLELFLERRSRPEWGVAENEIRRLRAAAAQHSLPALAQLHSVVGAEVRYQYAVWDGDGSRALEAARAVLTGLTNPGLQGYRALWFYLAGNAASLMAADNPAHDGTAREYFALAARAVPRIRWLRQLAGLRDEEVTAVRPGASAAPLIRRLERRLDALGTMHDQKFAALEHSILEGIGQTEAKAFERAQRDLGDLLGFEAGNEETDAAPDPWWVVDEALCFVFEDYTEATTPLLVAVKARQVASHPNWIRSHVPLNADARIIPCWSRRLRAPLRTQPSICRTWRSGAPLPSRLGQPRPCTSCGSCALPILGPVTCCCRPKPSPPSLRLAWTRTAPFNGCSPFEGHSTSPKSPRSATVHLSVVFLLHRGTGEAALRPRRVRSVREGPASEACRRA